MTLLSVLTALTADWKGNAIECDYALSVDDAGVPAVNIDPAAPEWSLPMSAQSVTIVATPSVQTFWPTTVTFSVGADGRLKPDADSAPWVTIVDVAVPGTVVTKASIVVSRFKDVSPEVIAESDKVPTTRQGKPATVRKDYEDRYGTWPPTDLDLVDRPAVNFLDLPVPVHGVSFSPDTTVHVKAENVVLQLAGVVAPKLWGVSWPESVERKDGADATSFLVFLRQGNAQYIGSFFAGDGQSAYPINFDYVTFGYFDDMAYPDPDVFNQPGSKGVPYQAVKAGANVVTVHPVNSLNEDFGVIESTKQLGRILLELQQFMFRTSGIAKPPTTLGKAALASFSSGTHILARMLARSDNLAESFLGSDVNAVYFLDAPQWSVTDCVTAALAWAGPPESDRRVRFYTQSLWDPLKKLFPGALPTPPFIKSSTLRTLGYIPTPSWVPIVKTEINVTLPADQVWQYAHHAIAATMLSHALSQGDFA
jgi:hypothetical protein